MSYNVLIAADAREYISFLDEKSTRIVKENLKKLAEDPYPRPASGSGDKEKVTVDGEEIYRLHIGRTHTAFYDVVESNDEVRVVELMDIDEAHKRYD